MKAKFDVQGMTCSSCSGHVERAVRKLDGVRNVTVNLLRNNMIVEYDESKVKINDVIKAVVEAGYGADLCKTGEMKNKEINYKESKNVEDNAKSLRKRLISSICFWIPLMYVAMHGISNQNAMIFAFTQFLLVLPIIYINRNYFINGFKRLIKKAPTMDSLVAIGSSASVIYGIYALYMIAYGFDNGQLDIIEKFSSELYFESAGTILTLITFGKFLESKSKGKTTAAIEQLINLSPKTAIIEKDNKEIELLTEEINKDDIIIIKPGSKIPVDGVIIEGKSSIDQSSITGESIPVEKIVGDDVISGTVNKNGYFKMKAIKVGEDTTLAQIVRLVEEASNSKAPISKIADKVSSIFVPVVILIALCSTVFWLLNGQGLEFALGIGVSVLVISCPCALGLATPVAIMVGTGKGATNGILIKSAESLETLHSINTVVFDKTGTITTGKPKVIDVEVNFLNKDNTISKRDLLHIAASLERNSEHPLAEAIVEHAKKEKINVKDVINFISITGRGVKGEIDGVTYYGGNEKFMFENRVKEFELKNLNNLENNKFLEIAQNLLNQGKTVLYFARNDELIGIIAIADIIKDTAKETITSLKKKKIDVVMITGDNELVAESIGKQVGIEKIIAGVLPQDKEKEVLKLQEEGKKVAFVGDGINDSPALVRADVGIAIGSGTDIAIESADIVLKNDNLINVYTAIELSKAVIKNIKMNLFWAFFYNSIGIPIAAGALYLSHGLRLNPMIGAAAMSMSSVCVVTNALTLNLFKIKNNSNKEQLVSELNKGGNKMKKEIIINGMQCNHCKMTVEKVLVSLEGIEKVDVNLENKSAIIECAQEVNESKIKEVIEEAGFVVVEIK